MNFDGYLRDLRSAAFYRGQISHVERIPPREARYGSLEKPLSDELAASLSRLEIQKLYSHQAEAINAARSGEHVTIVTATASGKTLCYNLPAIDAILQDSRARALYLFPTKALAHDQLGKLNDFGLFPTLRFASYDGDTPAAERRYVKRGAHIVLTNPDMLHIGILPYHSTWSAFFSNLKYIVIDEMHTYRGVFGSHLANILRRARRICSFYGSAPQFICCSATIANADELTACLTGERRAVIIEENGAPTGPRTFVFWNPPFIDDAQAIRRSSNMEATHLFTDLVGQGVRTITFTRSRKSAELILRYARGAFEHKSPELSGRVMSYRAGFTPEERRTIEEGLLNGRLLGVTSTNALELGVDIGGLDATVLTGYPGTIAAAWQQAGRAGRGCRESLSIMVAQDNPLDQFLMRNPSYFFGRPHECATVDPDNRRILAQHILCAAYERAILREEMETLGSNVRPILDTLTDQGKLFRRGGRWHYAGDKYPAAAVNIRSASNTIIKIVDSERHDRLVGTVEEAAAHKSVHTGAVYLHMGDTYLVEELDLARGLARVRAVEAAYYTEARESSHILILDTRRRGMCGDATACFGDVVVTNRVLGYRRKKLFTDEVLDVIDLELPEQTFETEAFWLTVPPLILTDFLTGGGDLAGSIHAIEHAAIGMMPLLATCDRWDIGGVSHVDHPDTALPTVFIYDAYAGGVGIAEAVFPRLEELLSAALRMIRDCACAEGCPSCIQSPKCGNNNEPLDKLGACRLLEALLGVELPAKEYAA